VWPDAPVTATNACATTSASAPAAAQRQAPHSALHDARVTAQILDELLRAGTSIEDMLKWTTEPAMLPTCPLGDWRGKKWADVDQGFLRLDPLQGAGHARGHQVSARTPR
jgi:exodeoxyribonuclease X